ncbi:MAG: NAD(P)H-binding protein [Thermoguttaceae bacterium]|jgi:NADH dehydrogenase
MQTDSPFQVVTGAFGYSGQYIARRLLDRGVAVRTLTNSPERENPLHGRVVAGAYHFDDPARLTQSLAGAEVLYNTYWVRFNSRDFSHATAVENTLKLFTAAKEAGVARLVHISIANPSEDSPLEYYRGKARLERALIESGLSYSILRPTVLFGGEDILINNIAWMLRHLPVVGVFGDGRYGIRPIHVEDLADLAVQEGHSTGNRIVDAVGPETFTYRELLRRIGLLIGKPRRAISVPPWLGYLATRALGKVLRDVIITREEIAGLMAGLLSVDSPATGKTRLTDWARQNADTLGRRYASELARRRDRRRAYREL